MPCPGNRVAYTNRVKLEMGKNLTVRGLGHVTLSLLEGLTLSWYENSLRPALARRTLKMELIRTRDCGLPCLGSAQLRGVSGWLGENDQRRFHQGRESETPTESKAKNLSRNVDPAA